MCCFLHYQMHMTDPYEFCWNQKSSQNQSDIEKEWLPFINIVICHGYTLCFGVMRLYLVYRANSAFFNNACIYGKLNTKRIRLSKSYRGIVCAVTKTIYHSISVVYIIRYRRCSIFQTTSQYVPPNYVLTNRYALQILALQYFQHDIIIQNHNCQYFRHNFINFGENQQWVLL